MNAAQREVRSLRPSAVSQALKAINDSTAVEIAPSIPAAKTALARFDLQAASNLRLREQAYRLAFEAYSKKGYVPEDANDLATRYDARPDTLTVIALAHDEQRKPAGTVSVIFDSIEGLPCDEIFQAEVTALRQARRWVVEVTRLAIADEHANSRDLLALLCNIPIRYSMQVRGFTDMVVEVNPRHVQFYQRLMKFTVLGGERPCPRVNGAPAILLHLDMVHMLPEMQRLMGRGAICKERSLYPHFLAAGDEHLCLQRLASEHRPMTVAEIEYFRLYRGAAYSESPVRLTA